MKLTTKVIYIGCILYGHGFGPLAIQPFDVIDRDETDGVGCLDVSGILLRQDSY